MRKPARIAIPVALAAALACKDTPRTIAETPGASTCASCHGDAVTPAPDQGAHRRHVLGGVVGGPVACNECHVVPATLQAAGHIDPPPAEVTFGPLATANGSAAVWAGGACASTWCHGAKLAGGNAKTPAWTATGPAECGGCHGAPPPNGSHASVAADPRACVQCHPRTVRADGTIDLAGGLHVNGTIEYGAHPGTWLATHGDAAKAGLASCAAAACHGATLDGVGAARACADCHGAGWKTDCTMCHGSAATGVSSPPVDTHGQTATTVVTVGAHEAHVVRAGYDCTTCHVKPADALSAGHVDGATATVTFGLPATANGATPTWDRSTATCASTWCHTAGLGTGGATYPAPVWTEAGLGKAGCGSCHGLPPPAATGHPAVSGDLTTCAPCHPQSVTPSGAVIPPALGGTHLDGAIQGGGHPVGWVDPAQHGAAADSGIAQCQPCHGQDLGGVAGGAGSCDRCHVDRTGAGGTAWRTDCTFCHGDPATGTASPPADVPGGTATTLVTVGAHASHVGAVHGLSSPMTCTRCHPAMPSDVLSAGHMDGPPAEVALATGTWTRTSATCTASACHALGGSAPNPVWTTVNGSQAACTSCHPSPPSLPHPPSSQCGGCHGTGYGAATVVASTHVNGTVDLAAGRSGCVACHGDPARTPVPGADANANAAPPADASGDTAAAARGVGAHLAHVNQATFRQAPIACDECHVVPAAGDTSHANGVPAVAFGALARNASWGGVTPAPSWNGTTCASTYCHGAFHGGAAAAPAWAQDVALDCTSCHGAPPGGTHPASPSCGNCHAGYTATSVDKAKHLNGALDVSAMTCASCHGDGTRVATPGADANVKASPPVDTLGQSTGARVGAHLAHVNRSGIAAPLACAVCHGTMDAVHPSGALKIAFTGLAGTGASYLGGQCASTYCHAQGGTTPSPSWTGGAMGCDSCHGAPPTAGLHPQNPSCGTCHLGYTATSVDGAAHLNGTVDVSVTCTSCHGDDGRVAVVGADADVKASPPVDTLGQSTGARVGAHLAHVNRSALAAPLACAVCHGTMDAVHPSGVLKLAFTGLAGTGASYLGGQCASTYCHAQGGTTPSPSWTGGAAACDSCHGAPPTAGGHPQNPSCGTCHTGFTATTVDPGRHVNGTVDVVPLTCTTCHGKAGGTATPSAPLDAAPPVDTAGASTGIRVGAHQKHLLGGSFSNPLPCQTCHAGVGTYTTTHWNGTSDVGFGGAANANLALGTWNPGSGTSAGSCSATWCHAVATRNGVAADGALTTPAWDGAVSSCVACHGTPPGTGKHAFHLGYACFVCHGPGYSTTTVSKALHVDGVRNVAATINFNGSTCSNTCHGARGWWL